MKLFFLNNDTLYKIFTTIEKVAKRSSVQIFIESENHFFHNNWWAKQIKQLLKEREINATFITESQSQKKYFEINELQYELRQEHIRRKILNITYRFFFNIKKFHLYVYQKRSYTFFAVFGAEMVFLGVVLYILYSLILPKTTITITPSYQINEIAYNFRYLAPEKIKDYPYPESHIIIPLHYNSLHLTKSLTIDGEKIQYITNPSKGQVRIVNKTQESITLVKGTQLVSDDGILVTIDNRVKIPAAGGDGKAGYSYVSATSKENDINDIAIGSRGNIKQGTELLIKNLKQSKYTKSVYAEVTTNFNGGSLSKSGTIVPSDIGLLQKKLYESLSKDKYGQGKKVISDKSLVVLPFEELFVIDDCTYNSIGNNNELSKLTTLSGSLSCTLQYPFVYNHDIETAVLAYLEQRKSNIHNLASIITESINFTQLMTGEYSSYIIPTKINTIQGYNFEEDANSIIDAIIEKSSGLPKKEAKEMILAYPEISNVSLKISPPWYNLVSNLKSRIFIKIQKDQK